jgi:endonuclease-3
VSPPDTELGRRSAFPDVPSVVRRLERAYGPRPWRKHRSGIDGLVRTILSQNTSDANSRAAFRSLRRRFPTWEQVLDAPTSEVERAIRVGGLSRVKAPRIKAALRQIRRTRGKLSLAFLARLPLDDARRYLQALDGIGPKTACCVLMFCYERPALPVDTHVHRVARRVGLIPPQCSAETAHALLQKACPPEMVYPFHVLMVEHGRRTCRARDARCRSCVLADVCRSRPGLPR